MRHGQWNQLGRTICRETKIAAHDLHVGRFDCPVAVSIGRDEVIGVTRTATDHGLLQRGIVTIHVSIEIDVASDEQCQFIFTGRAGKLQQLQVRRLNGEQGEGRTRRATSHERFVAGQGGNLRLRSAARARLDAHAYEYQFHRGSRRFPTGGC